MKLFDLIPELIEVDMELTLRKSEGVLCAHFPSGFYQSDGDAYIKQHKENVVLYTRFGGQTMIGSLELLVYESHLAWRKCRNMNDKWRQPAVQWLPLYKRHKLEIFPH